MVPSCNNFATKVNHVYFGLPQEKSTPLIIAAKRGYPEIVDALLADGRADVNTRNKVKQRDAYYFCPWLNPDYPSALLQHGSTALTWASWNINNETVIALLGRADIDVNMQDGVSFCNFSFLEKVPLTFDLQHERRINGALWFTLAKKAALIVLSHYCSIQISKWTHLVEQMYEHFVQFSSVYSYLTASSNRFFRAMIQRWCLPVVQTASLPKQWKPC